MKHPLLFLTLLLLLCTCKKESDETQTGWTDEDRTYYHNVAALQETAWEKYLGWRQTMDSLEAIGQLVQYFRDDPSVSQVTQGTQGIAVVYTNGLRGGIFLNPADDPDTAFAPPGPHAGSPGHQPAGGEKSLVNNKTMILLNPTYWERSKYADQIIAITGNKSLPKTGFRLTTIYKNTGATLDRFSELGGYGYIHVYSHGWAWPEEQNTEDVLLLTGEQSNDATAEKYWGDLRAGRVTVAMTNSATGRRNTYWISKDFVAQHNNFSNDTVLFYGGFCYSFVGKWPDITDRFGKGTFVGFSWSVRTNWNTNWSLNLVHHLCDTSRAVPANPELWMAMASMPKQYVDPGSQKTVSVGYAGDGALSFWKPGNPPADTLPQVTTAPAGEITATTARSGGNVTHAGLTPVTARGVCWSTQPLPTVNDAKTSDGAGTGAFTSDLTGLDPFTTYYLRAYATNSFGTAYGDTVSFRTAGEMGQPCPELPLVTDDRDGQVYPTVQIGNQCWMKKNMNLYVPGTQCYDRDTANCITYGRLYNWEAAKAVCPPGWHLPSFDEFTELRENLGGFLVAGGKMKETGTVHWAAPNTGATNESGFNALPAGWDNQGNFESLTLAAIFWTSTEWPPYSAWFVSLGYTHETLNDAGRYPYYGHSVRCLKE